jgi:hypothetical protein
MKEKKCRPNPDKVSMAERRLNVVKKVPTEISGFISLDNPLRILFHSN